MLTNSALTEVQTMHAKLSLVVAGGEQSGQYLLNKLNQFKQLYKSNVSIKYQQGRKQIVKIFYHK